MATKPTTLKQGHCPTCNADRNAVVQARYDDEWHDQENNVDGVQEHYILKCAGCGAVFFQIDASDNQEMERGEWNDEVNEYEWSEKHVLTHYPAKTRRPKPTWLIHAEIEDRVLGRLLRELYVALDADLRVLAAVGMRTVFDRTSELLQVDPSLPFDAKLTRLVDLGKIGADERALLSDLVDAGSAAAHRGWSPKSEDVNTMMDVVEALLKRTFVLGREMKEMKGRVPPKPPRIPKTPKKPVGP